jgi:DNA-binding transcriptional regulator YiaG
MPKKVKNSLNPEALVRNQAAAMAVIVANQGERVSPRLDDTLKSRRESLGLTTENVCSALVIASSSLRNYESGRSLLKLPPHQLQDLMQILQVSFEELLLLCSNSAPKDTQATLRAIGRKSPYSKAA